MTTARDGSESTQEPALAVGGVVERRPRATEMLDKGNRHEFYREIRRPKTVPDRRYTRST